ncbi:MAG: C39 family peptidase, partial [Chloroflexi bacterium]|nr:C39 family peptidase [Chloroflexota bacterium]
MRIVRTAAVTVGAIAVVLGGVLLGADATAKSGPTTPNVSFVRASLSGGGTAGVDSSTGALVLAATGLTTGTYPDPHQSAVAVAYESGSWIGDWVGAPFAFDELIASWNAATPAGTWVKIEMQAAGSARETVWYVLGIWASGDGDIRRTSVAGQGDADGSVAVDTFVRGKKAAPLDGYRLRATLYRRAGTSASPTVRGLAAMISTTARYEIPSMSTGVARDLAVPQRSQETHVGHYPEYDNGGEAWCSPTSTAMVLRYWGAGPSATDLAAFPGHDAASGAPHIDGEVDHAARYVFDWQYNGAGNWPFNTAYATTFAAPVTNTSPGGQIDGFVTRLRSLAEAELFIAAGIPLVASINGKLEGFLFGSTNGHLLVIRGFDASGDVISNDPAVMSNADVRKTYGRADFERVWLEGSGGLVYVIRPTGVRLPPNVPGPANW